MTNSIDNLSRIHGFIDAIHSRNKPELIVDAVTKILVRLLQGDGEDKAGLGDISLLQRLNKVIRSKAVSGNSAVKKAWIPFLQSLVFLKLDNDLNVIGQDTPLAIANSEHEASHWRDQYTKLVNEIKKEMSANRTIKTDLERFVTLGEKLGLNPVQLQAMVDSVSTETHTEVAKVVNL